jgi:hypothetical protein
MSRFSIGTLGTALSICTIFGLATPAHAGHDLRSQAHELEQQTCALASTVERGYRSARDYECLLAETARLETIVGQIGCIVADPRQARKAEYLLRQAERQAETVCDLLNDVNHSCVPKHARKRANQLIDCIEGDIDDLADAVADCNDHHHRPVFGAAPRQGGWGFFIRR